MGSARGALQGVQDFSQFDSATYMNPYIKAALDPTAREVREQGTRNRNDLLGRMDAAGAYGSRAALSLREQDELTQQGISDVYGRGYAEAFDRGSALWSADQDRKMQKSQQFMQLAGLGSDLVDKDIGRLMSTGAVQRSVDQSMKDFDYQQFTEGRDWGGKQAAYLTDVLRGLKGSYTETQLTKETQKSSGNVLGQVLGTAATIAGAYFTGGASLALQAGVGAGAGALSRGVINKGETDWAASAASAGVG